MWNGLFNTTERFEELVGEPGDEPRVRGPLGFSFVMPFTQSSDLTLIGLKKFGHSEQFANSAHGSIVGETIGRINKQVVCSS